MRKAVFCITLTLILLTAALPAAGDQKGDVETLLKSRVDAVLDVLKKSKMPDAQKQEKIMEIIGPVFDFELMARLTLGRANWMKLTADEQATFIDLFVARLKKTYLEKTSLYSDEDVIYRPAVVVGDKIHASVGIDTREKVVEIAYKFYAAGDQWKIYDVEVEGVSIVMSYRSQFNQIMQRGTAKDLLDELRKAEVDTAS
jgi:phospholipid transport system substrate-binding protein